MSQSGPVTSLPPSPASVPEAALIMLQTYPGPAIFVRNGEVGACNPAATLLLERDGKWWKSLQEWLGTETRTPEVVRIPTEASPILVEWTSTRLSAQEMILLGRNITLERNLQEVLTDSRDRFRGLVELTADLAWETDRDGNFTYVAGGKSLGYTAEELLGKRARDLLIRQPMEQADYFENQVRLDKKEAWIRRADGSSARVLISSQPLRDAAGQPRGMRGLCRDITDDAARAEELAQIQRRDQLVARFVKSLREVKEAQTALEIAAREITAALGAKGCRIYHLDNRDELQMAIETGVALPEIVNSYTRRMKTEPRALIQEALNSAVIMGISTMHGAAVNGAIWVWRQGETGAWPAIDQNLLTEVADHLGIVITQIDYQNRLRELSENDGLTKLLNRRTFIEKLGQRLGRTTQASSLFYIDLDNFKAVNDTHGHPRGDAVIRKVADIIRATGTATDLAGRLGGDEFILWLDGVDSTAAETIARKLVASAAALRDLSASPDKPLGVSVGVAVAAAGEMISPATLLERSDNAMYEAKRSGKSTYAISRS